MKLLYLVGLTCTLFSGMVHSQSEKDPHAYKENLELLFRQIFSEPQKAAESLRELLKNKDKVHDTLQSITWNYLGVYYGVTHQTDSSLFAFDRALNLLPDNYHRVPGILKNKAIVYKNKGDLDNAFLMLNQGIEKAQEQGNIAMTAQLYGELASSHRQNKQLNLAINYLLKSIELLEEAGDVAPEIVAGEKQKLANTYLETGNCDFAVRLYNEVIPAFKNAGSMLNYYVTRVNLAECLLKENKETEALEIILDAYEGLKNIGNLEIVSFAANRTAKAYDQMKLISEAEVFYQEAYALSMEHNSVRMLMFSADYISFLLDQNRVADAKVIAETILENGYDQNAPLDNQIYFYKALTRVYQNQSNFSEAFLYTQKIQELNDTLQARQDKSLSLDLQAKYQNRLQHQENLILAQKISIQNRNNSILIGLVILFLFVAIFIWRVNFLNNRLKSTALAQKESEARELEVKFKYQKQLNELKEKTIEKQKQELLAGALEKIELNEKLESIIQNAGISGEKTLLGQLEKLKKQDKYWETLISKFYSLHPDFVQNIKKEFPKLSKSEVDFCSLIKMNFSFKEVASILQISHDSVISKKYRIAKKMNISGDEDFYTIVNRF